MDYNYVDPGNPKASDLNGDGSSQRPFKTIARALRENNGKRTALVATPEMVSEPWPPPAAHRGRGEVDEQREWMTARGFLPVYDAFAGRYWKGFNPRERYQFMSASWDEPSMLTLADQSPYFNIAGLYYRPARPDLEADGG